jgi:hypothetical protein
VIERLELRNYQKHAHTTVTFAPDITTIVGPSDRGKSAIVRALRWVCYNTPTGTGHRRHGAERYGVRLWVDGHVVTRQRDAKHNTYALDGDVFKAFAAGVPAPVVGLLNVGEINFQRQHDNMYWLAATPAAVSAELNSIVNLTLIDEALRHLAHAVRQDTIALGIEEQAYTDAKAARKALAYVAVLKEDWDALNKAYQTAVAARTRAAGLGGLLAAVAAAVARRAATVAAVGAGRAMVAAGQTALTKRAAANRLGGYLTGLDTARRKARHIPPFTGVTAAYKNATEARARADKLGRYLLHLRRLEGEREQWRQRLMNRQQARPAACPVCGQRLPPS